MDTADPSLPVSVVVSPPAEGTQWRGALSPKGAVTLSCGLVGILLVGLSLTSDSALDPLLGQSNTKKGHASFDSLNRAILKDYDTSRVFADFLPGIGGEFGIPMW